MKTRLWNHWRTQSSQFLRAQSEASHPPSTLLQPHTARRKRALRELHTLAQMSPMNNRRGCKGTIKEGVSAIFLCVTETSHVSAATTRSPPLTPGREKFPKSPFHLQVHLQSLRSGPTLQFHFKHQHQSIWLLVDDDRFTLPRLRISKAELGREGSWGRGLICSAGI